MKGRKKNVQLANINNIPVVPVVPVVLTRDVGTMERDFLDKFMGNGDVVTERHKSKTS